MVTLRKRLAPKYRAVARTSLLIYALLLVAGCVTMPPPDVPVIVLIGDSTVTDNKGWGGAFANALSGRAIVHNHARGGRSTKSFTDEKRLPPALAESPDYVFIQSEMVELPHEQRFVEIDLPQALHNRNVLVEVVGAGQNKTQAYYSNSMTVQVIENYGQLRVTHSQTRRPLAKVYVKAYAQMEDGMVRFYKDGYTDLRGRFDYTSLNTNELDHVRKFSLLVHSDECGAVVREANPPKR